MTAISKSLHVAFIADDNYVVPTCVSITSLINNLDEDCTLQIYIIATDIAPINSKIFKQFESSNVKVEIILKSVEKYKNFHDVFDHSRLSATIAALFKFELPHILFHLDKILYLDGDILVKKNVLDLWNSDIGETFGAVVEDSGKIYSGHPMVKARNIYFNSGVMLLNLKKMRDEMTTETLIQTKKNLEDQSLMDQHVFNIVFDGNVTLLPLKYNCLYINISRALLVDKKLTIKKINEHYNTNYKNLKHILNDANILHFASPEKPWKYTNGLMSKEWYKVFLKSPASNIPIVRDSTTKSHFIVHSIAIAPKVCKKFIHAVKEHGISNAVQKAKIYLYKRKHIQPIKIAILVAKPVLLLTAKFLTPFMLVGSKVKRFFQKIPRINGLNKLNRHNIKVIVSLTSYPGRINVVSLVIASMTRQTYKPDKIILYLSLKQFPDKKIPFALRLQQRFGVDIIFVEDDIRAHKKYYYAMRDYPQDIIITLDDDLYFDRFLIESLMESYEKHPSVISASRIHTMRFYEDGLLRPYVKWKQNNPKFTTQPLMSHFATNGAGTLFPPNCMHPELFNIEHIKNFCLHADDVWLKIMQVMNNTPVILARPYKQLRTIGGSQQEALWVTNVTQGQNDVQIKNVLEIYNDFWGNTDTLLVRMNDELEHLK